MSTIGALNLCVFGPLYVFTNVISFGLLSNHDLSSYARPNHRRDSLNDGVLLPTNCLYIFFILFFYVRIIENVMNVYIISSKKDEDS